VRGFIQEFGNLRARSGIDREAGFREQYIGKIEVKRSKDRKV